MSSFPKYALALFDDNTCKVIETKLIDFKKGETEDLFSYDDSHIVYFPKRPSPPTQSNIQKYRCAAQVLFFHDDRLKLNELLKQFKNNQIDKEYFQELRQEKSSAAQQSSEQPSSAATQSSEHHQPDMTNQQPNLIRDRAKRNVKPNQTESSLSKAVQPPRSKQSKSKTQQEKAAEKRRNQSLMNRIAVESTRTTTKKVISEVDEESSRDEDDSSASDSDDDPLDKLMAIMESGQNANNKKGQEGEGRNVSSPVADSGQNVYESQGDVSDDSSLGYVEATAPITDHRPVRPTEKVPHENKQEQRRLTNKRDDSPSCLVKELMGKVSSLEKQKEELLNELEKMRMQVQYEKDRNRSLQEEKASLRDFTETCQQKVAFFESFLDVDELTKRCDAMKKTLREFGDEFIRLKASTPSDQSTSRLSDSTILGCHNQGANATGSSITPHLSSSASPSDEDDEESDDDADKAHNNRPSFPIPRSVVDSIASAKKASPSLLVGALLKKMYTDQYMATHTMTVKPGSVGTGGKQPMDSSQVENLCDTVLDHFGLLHLGKRPDPLKAAAKEEMIRKLRKTITSQLQNATVRYKNQQAAAALRGDGEKTKKPDVEA